MGEGRGEGWVEYQGEEGERREKGVDGKERGLDWSLLGG
jgi:hypothetical protein